VVATISKEEISAYPVAQFGGEIILVDNETDAADAVSYLSEFDAVGFDTETRPSFKKGKSHKVALMQLATEERCYLFRLNIIGITDSLTGLLTNPDIKKIGLSLKDDFSVIRRSSPILPEGFVELQTFVKQFGIEEMGLQRIYAILFNERISKRQRLTNWEAKELSESQQHYAALDAWACLRIYSKLVSLEKQQNNEHEQI